MFKRIIAAAFIAVLAACGGQAQAAAPTAETYVSTAGQVISLHNAMLVDAATTPGLVVVTYINNTQQYVNDTGALMNKILVKNPHLVQMADGRYLNPNVSSKPTCSNNVLYMPIFGAGTYTYADNGCAIFGQIKANSH